MLFSRLSPLLWAGLTALSRATPMPMDVAIPLGHEATELEMRAAIEKVTQVRHLEKRLSADFRMDKSWKNEVLFAGSWRNSDPQNPEHVSLAVTCLECYTKGNVRTKLFENIFDPKVRLEFQGVEAYVNMNIAMSAGATYAVNLYTSNSPIGLGFPGLSVGVVFYVDLVFSLTEEIDLSGGFYVKVADDAFLEASVFGGDITDSFFNGLQSHSLPVTVQVGRATFKANLRLRVQCGAEADIDLFGIGAGAVMGIYANIIEFVAVLEYTPTCALQARQWWDLNVGAYARLNVVVDYTTIGFVPTVSTTLLSAPTVTMCFIEGGANGGVGGGASGSPAVTGLPPPPTTTFAVSTSAPAIRTVTTPSTLPHGSAGTTLLSTTRTSSPTIPLSTGAASSGSMTTSTISSSGPFTNVTTTSAPSQPDLVTTTIFSTTTYTVTACAAGVINCPASFQQEIVVTQTVQAFTTVCPADATITAIPSSAAQTTSTTAVPVPSDLAVLLVVTEMVVLEPCATPVVETFVPPPALPTPVVHHIDAVAPSQGLFGGGFLALPTSPAEAGSGFGANDVTTSSSSSSSMSSVAAAKPNGNSTTPSGVAQGSGKPSASYSPPAAASKPVTAGAADRAASFVAVLIALGGAVALL